MRVLIVLALIGLCYATSDTELFREVYAKYHEADGLQAEPPVSRPPWESTPIIYIGYSDSADF